MGRGSNILVSDEGFDGLVLLNKIDGIKHTKEGDKAVIVAGAGEDWQNLVDFAVKNGFAGVETLSGIPGSVGGAPIQNIGAYGGEASHVIKEVVVYDTEKGKIVRLGKAECDFGYRKSVFNAKHPGRYVVLEVVFELKVGGEPTLLYQDLKLHFADRPKPGLKDVHLAVMEIRARKGMVIHPDFESYKSAGSFFKNPVVSKEIFESAKEKIGVGDGKWFWPASDGSVKVSAARLIEASGFSKGFKSGNAGISPKHSLSLINLGGAKASELIDLAKSIISAIKEKFGVSIEPEVQLVGFKENPFK
jgi:UDP-N-acetylmuramate dehydrogenase